MDIKWVELRKKIQEAELVLVGIGEECQYDWSALLQDGDRKSVV